MGCGSCCQFTFILIFECIAWALAAVAISTSFWLGERTCPGYLRQGLRLSFLFVPRNAPLRSLSRAEPDPSTLLAASHAGLWRTCFRSVPVR